MAKNSKEVEAGIAKQQALKTKRRKARKARNAKLREAGTKFSKKDHCYKG